jgi:hypothetical protein
MQRTRDAKLAKENAELRKMLNAHRRSAGGHLLVPCLGCQQPTGDWCSTCFGAVCPKCQETHPAKCQSVVDELRAELSRAQLLLEASDKAQLDVNDERDATINERDCYKLALTTLRDAARAACAARGHVHTDPAQRGATLDAAEVERLIVATMNRGGR